MRSIFARMSIPLRLSLAYCFFSCCWIIFSGRIAETMAGGDPHRLNHIESMKGIFFVAVSTLFLFFISRRLYQRQRDLQQLYHERELHQKNETARSIVNAEETERNRWAEELHDNISQLLSVANLYAGTLTKPGTNLNDTVARVREMIELAIQEIRRLSANLKPPSFEDTGLHSAISELTRSVSDVREIRFDIIQDTSATGIMTEEHQLMVYRIVQESINNIIKYADASEVVIALGVTGNEAVVRITDNGRGVDLTEVREGTGIRNIRSRLELFDGQVELRSAPGQGFEINATFRL